MKKTHTKEYIKSRLAELGISRGDLGRKLGRSNKCLRRLDAFLETLQEQTEFISRIQTAIEADESIWKDCIAKDREQLRLEREALEKIREEKERAKFVPHLWMIGERRIPSPIHVVAFCGEAIFKKANLPQDILLFDLKTQINIVRRRFQLFCEERNRSAGPFGPIIGYHYRQTYDIAYEFDMEGSLLSTLRGKFPRNKASLTIKGKDLGNSFRQEG